MATRLQRARALRRRIVAGDRSASTLRQYLTLKALLRIWDRRFLNGHPDPGNRAVRSAIMRGYAAGLVVTATSDGRHAPGSYHALRRAADFGLRGPEVGTAAGRRKLVAFQLAEHRRAAAGKTHPVELLGPDNGLAILRGRFTDLREGTGLENQHDNHDHEAF